MRILIADDDRKLARQLKKGVDESGHVTTLAYDGLEALATAEAGAFDVLVLDVMMPGMDGVTLVRQLRQRRIATPILLLTARDAPEDIANGLDAGADDYLTKPFSFQVLLARLRALARRRQVDPQALLRVADLSLDPATHEVRRSGVPVALPRTEFLMLEILMRSSGRVITRARLMEAVWGYERDVQSNTLDVFIRQLRARIEPPGSAKLLHTVRGVGYTLRDEERL
jgi:two-component system response regulator MprA